MSDFTLDTSGEVRGARLIEQTDGNWRSHWSWPDLSPFAQGYVEAMLESIRYERASAGIAAGVHYRKWDERTNCATSRHLAFRDLASETLALIRRDCAAFRVYGAREFFDRIEDTPKHGAHFWTGRNSRLWPSKPERDGFPPLTPYLGDDGKIYLRP